jgi:hypothetical protein
MDVEIPVERCGDCVWCRAAGKLWRCRRHPPQIMFQALAAPTLAGAKPAISWCQNAAYPLVQEDTPGCGDGRRRAERLN